MITTTHYGCALALEITYSSSAFSLRNAMNAMSHLAFVDYNKAFGSGNVGQHSRSNQFEYLDIASVD